MTFLLDAIRGAVFWILIFGSMGFWMWLLLPLDDRFRAFPIIFGGIGLLVASLFIGILLYSLVKP